jgi:hypothetical protein
MLMVNILSIKDSFLLLFKNRDFREIRNRKTVGFFNTRHSIAAYLLSSFTDFIILRLDGRPTGKLPESIYRGRINHYKW